MRLLLPLALFATAPLFAQDDASLVLLARTFKDNVFKNEPTKEQLARLRTEIPAEMHAARDFIVQSVSPKNDLLEPEWMELPDEATLRQIHLVRRLELDMRAEKRIGDQLMLDSLRRHPASRYELVRNYYNTLFTSVGNKNQPFNLSKLDLRTEAYGPLDETERAIAFLECMDLCRSVIWGYMNIPKPPNTKEAMANIKRYPKVNGAAYYRFGDLNFRDFQFVFDDSLQSYKGVMIDHYLELLLLHALVLDGQGAKEEEMQDLLLGSAMRDDTLWKYSKNKAVFENIFKKQ